MKNFIVPTDFSQNAKHASAYAIQLATQLHTRIILMHAFEAPIAVSEYELTTIHFHSMKERVMEQLEDRKLELQAQFGETVPIECVTFDNDLIGHIKELYADPDARLAVIGLTGAGMVNFFLGSNTLNIVNNVGRMILTVPPYADFRPIKKILFACEMKNVASTVPIKRIKRLLELLNATLLVLDIHFSQKVSPEKKAEIETLKKMLEGFSFSFHTIDKHNIVAGIKDYAREQKADLIAIIPQKRDFLESLLGGNRTKAMLFRSTIPILTIPPDE